MANQRWLQTISIEAMPSCRSRNFSKSFPNREPPDPFSSPIENAYLLPSMSMTPLLISAISSMFRLPIRGLPRSSASTRVNLSKIAPGRKSFGSVKKSFPDFQSLPCTMMESTHGGFIKFGFFGPRKTIEQAKQQTPRDSLTLISFLFSMTTTFVWLLVPRICSNCSIFLKLWCCSA